MVTKNNKYKDVLFIRKVPLHLKVQFRARCVRRGESMQDVIKALMEAWTNGDVKVKVNHKKKEES